MDLRKLKTLIDLVSESNISELEITEAEGKVRIVKEGSRAGVTYAAPSPGAPAPVPAPVAAESLVPPPPAPAAAVVLVGATVVLVCFCVIAWRGLRIVYLRHAGQHHRFFTDREISIDSARDLKAVLFPAVMIAFFLLLLSSPAWAVVGRDAGRGRACPKTYR